MESLDQDKNVEPTGDLQYDKKSMAAVQAAMMEELGFARKEKLPLEDRRGFKGQVDLDALDRQKKANDPCTLEYKIAQENSAAHTAWKNVRFNDLDQTTLGLDTMNMGQSHRARMNADLASLNSSRGGNSHREGRGGLPSRGSSFTSNIGDKSSGRRRRKHVPLEVVMAHLRGNEVPRGSSARTKQGFRHGSAAYAARHKAVPTPEPNLSFKDNRPINELPIRQNIANYAKPGTEKDRSMSAIDPIPIRHRQNFVLTEPDKFMAVAWPDRISRDSQHSDNLQKSSENEVFIPAGSATNIRGNTTKEYQKQPKTDTSTTINSNLTEPPHRARNGKPSNENYRAVHEVEVKVEKVEGLSTISLGQGMARIFIDIRKPQTPGVIEVEVEHEIVLEIHLCEHSKHSLDSSIMSFDLSINGHSVKWVLRTPLPWKAKQFYEEIDRHKSLATISPQDGSNAQSDVKRLSSAIEIETLISFEKAEYLQPQYPSFTEDLLSLMDDQTIDNTLEAINFDSSGPLLDQISTMMAEADPTEEILSVLPQIRDVQVSTKGVLGGLATSRFAAANTLVDKFLSKSSVYKSLPVETAVALTEKISKRGLAKAENSIHMKAAVASAGNTTYSHIQESIGMFEREKDPNSMVRSEAAADARTNDIANMKQISGLQYAVEEMIGYRKNASQIINPPASAPWVSLVIQHNHRSSTILDAAIGLKSSNPLSSKVLDTAHSKAPAMAFIEKPTSFQGLASSKYATGTPTNIEKVNAISSKAAYAGASTSATGKPPKSLGFDYSRHSSSTMLTDNRMTDTLGKAPTKLPVSSTVHYSSADPVEKTISKYRALIDLEPDTCFGERETFACSEMLKSEMIRGYSRNANTLRFKGNDTMNVGSSLNKKTEYAEKTVDTTSSMDVASGEQLHSATLAGYTGFQRYDSFGILTPQDSEEVTKPVIYKGPQVLTQTVQDDKHILPEITRSLQHVSALSTNSGIRSASVKTTMDGAHPERDCIAEKRMDVSAEFQAQRSFEKQVVTQHANINYKPREIAVESGPFGTSATTSACRSEMSDFAASLKARGGLATSRYAADPRSDLLDHTKSLSRPSLSPFTKLSRTDDSPTIRSLHASKAAGIYLDDVHDNMPPALQPRVRPAAEMIGEHLKIGAKSQDVAPNPLRNTQDRNIHKSSLSLRPTATEFTPPKTSTVVTPNRDIFLQPMAALTPTEPLIATILVPDGTGGYREVSGILTAARVPIVSREAFQSLRTTVDENANPGSLINARLPQSPLQPHSQSSLATGHLKDSSSAHDFQQEIPKRLQKSLALRKFSD